MPLTQRRTSARTRRIWHWGALATACAVAIVVAYQLDIVVRLKADHRTATGEQLQIELPDRSTATLNTKSAIAVNFDGMARKVRLLDGEAFFQVEPDQDRPFLVEGQQIVSRAVSTKFLVRRQSDEIRVTVVEGIVELASTEGGWEPIQLTAGQQTAVDSHVMGPIRQVDVQAATAWLRGRLMFENVRLAEVIDEIRRYHRGVIVIWGPTLGDMRVSGSYTLTDPDEILATLAQTLPIHMAHLGSRVVALF
ncbi:MAG: FecR domain-containing protein [Nitrospira sp.]|nr:FecR domain-containing protein [Nitrospira sp.]